MERKCAEGHIESIWNLEVHIEILQKPIELWSMNDISNCKTTSLILQNILVLGLVIEDIN